MKHLSQEELIDCYYGEEAGPETRPHLEACTQCSAALMELTGDLASVTSAEPPQQDAAYGRRIWDLLAPSLRPYPPPRRSWFRLRPLPAAAAACLLLLAAAFYAGRRWELRQTPPQAHTPVQPAPKAVILVVLGDHLDRSERLLVQLKHADPSSTESVAPLRDEARILLAANRVCRQNSSRFGDPALSGALDRLDGILTELANQSNGLTPAALARLQKQASADGLLFEVRVLRSHLPDPTAKIARSTGGTT